MIVDIPKEHRKIIRVDSKSGFLLVNIQEHCFFYGKRSDTEYVFNCYLPVGRYSVDLTKFYNENPNCLYLGLMYDDRFIAPYLENTTFDTFEYLVFDFIKEGVK